MTRPDTTDRATLAGSAYADGRHLAKRQALYEWQTPRYDLPKMVTEHLAGTYGTVIDVGCGNGKYLRRLASDRPDLRLVGVDISSGILAGIPTPVIVADAHELPFPDGTASAALAMHMLYHLDDIDRGIAELHRVLRPGGIAVVSTNSAYDKTELDELWSCAAGDVLGTHPGPHRVSLSSRFPLEQAPSLLGRYFDDVAVTPLSGTIIVNDPEPVVAHLGSYQTWADQQGLPFHATLEQVRERLSEIIRRHGVFRISCLGGILVCHRRS